MAEGAGAGGVAHGHGGPAPEAVLRPLRPTDRARVALLGGTLFAPFGDYGDALDRWLRHPDVRTVVAASARTPVGFAMVGPVADAGGVDVYLLGIGVDPERQRRGLGSRLLASAIEEARRRARRWGARRLRLDVAPSNAAAIALFRRAGFVELPGAEPPAYHSGERPLAMVLPLG